MNTHFAAAVQCLMENIEIFIWKFRQKTVNQQKKLFVFYHTINNSTSLNVNKITNTYKIPNLKSEFIPMSI